MRTSDSPLTLSPGLRRFLYLTALINGAAILVVEILGAKILAPYLGTSHFVWTAQISVTLLSLAAGYYWGGRMVDRDSSLRRLYLAILGAALYLALTLWLAEKVAYFGLDLGIQLGSVVASAFLFFVPLTLLAMTGPFLIRVLASSLHQVGRQAGHLSAVSTLGSVLGAGLIGYVLIPFLPNSTTLLITAGLLILQSVIYFVIFEQARSKAVLPILITIGGLGFGVWGAAASRGTEFGSRDEIYRANSNFGMLQVLQTRNSSQLLYVNDFLIQNIYYNDTKQSGALFTYMLHGLAHCYTPRIESALCIGMGVGIVPSQFAREGVKVDVVEINEAVLPVAQKYFNLDPSIFRLHIGDGRHFLNRATNRYDVVALDAFLGDSSPSHLMTKEAFGSMKRVLNPDGTLVMNCFGYLDYGRDFFIASLERTLQATFKTVRIHASARGNLFVLASDRAGFEPLTPLDYEAIHPSVRDEAKATMVTLVSTARDHGMVLSDDYNPIEYRDAKNREAFRRNMAISLRSH